MDRRSTLRAYAVTLVVAVLVGLIVVAVSPARAGTNDTQTEGCFDEVEAFRWYRSYEGPKEIEGFKYVNGAWQSAEGWHAVPDALNPPSNLQVNSSGTFTGNNKPYGLPNSPNQIKWRYQGGEEWWPSEDGYALNLTGAPQGAWGNPVATIFDYKVPTECPEETTTTTVPDTTTTIPEVELSCEAYTVTIPQDGNGVTYGLGRFIAGWEFESADADNLEAGVTYTVFSQVAEGFERDALPQGWVEVDALIAYYNFTTEEEVCNYDVPPISAQVIITTTTTVPEETTTTTEPEDTTTTTTPEETTTTVPEETTTTVVEDTTTTTTEAPVVTTTVPAPPTELPLTGAGYLWLFAVVGGLLALLGLATVVASRRVNR